HERPEPADLDELRHDQFLSGNRNQPCTRNFLPAFRWKDRWFRPRPSAELHVLEKPCGRRSEYRRQKRLDKRAFSDDHWRSPGRLRRSLFDYGHTGLLAGGNGNATLDSPKDFLTNRRVGNVAILGRLKPGMKVGQAQPVLAIVARR